MTVAMSILCQDSAYYYETKGTSTVVVGKISTADVRVPNLAFDLAITANRNGASIRLGDNREIMAPLDAYSILPVQDRIYVYFRFVADRKAWGDQRIVPGFAISFGVDFPALEPRNFTYCL